MITDAIAWIAALPHDSRGGALGLALAAGLAVEELPFKMKPLRYADTLLFSESYPPAWAERFAASELAREALARAAVPADPGSMAVVMAAISRRVESFAGARLRPAAAPAAASSMANSWDRRRSAVHRLDIDDAAPHGAKP